LWQTWAPPSTRQCRRTCAMPQRQRSSSRLILPLGGPDPASLPHRKTKRVLGEMYELCNLFLYDEAAGAGFMAMGCGTEYIPRVIRVVLNYVRCRTYAALPVRWRGGEGWLLPVVSFSLSPCPHLVAEYKGRLALLYPVVHFDGFSLDGVAAYYISRRRPTDVGKRHLWPPVAAKGGRPARVVWSTRYPDVVDVAVFPDGVAEIERGSVSATQYYPVDYASGVAYLYGLDGRWTLVDELRVPGRGGHLGERFAVYAVEGEYLQMESPWGLDFAVNVVLGTVGGRWVLMDKDGLYLARFERAEGPGGRVGYAVVEGPYWGEVRAVEGPPFLGDVLPSTPSVKTKCPLGSLQVGDSEVCVRDDEVFYIATRWPLATFKGTPGQYAVRLAQLLHKKYKAAGQS